MRTLGIDWGDRRIGLALSDPTGAVATPLATLERKGDKADIGRIAQLIAQRGVERVVLGMPLDMKGEAGEAAERVMKFLRLLEQAVDVPVQTVDERFSSQAAERVLLEGDVSRKKRKQKRDGVAAAWFLQAFLDSEAGGGKV